VSRRTALFTALGGVGLAVLLVVLLLVSAGSGHVQGTNPSSPEFVIGNAGSYQHQVEKEHRPLIFPDPNEKGKNIVVQYVTGSGWHAFEAHVPNDTRCIIQWHRDTLQFTDCHGATYPAAGTGLVRFPPRVDPKGLLRIDVRHPIPA